METRAPPESTTTVAVPKYLQEPSMASECALLMSSLPKETGWLSTYLYQYQGFWHPSTILPALISSQTQFHSLSSDILLVTTPKSGTTWLKALIFSIMNRNIHPPAAPSHPLLSSSPHDQVPFLEYNLYKNATSPDLSAFHPPRIFATHLPFVSLPKSVGKGDDDSGCKLVYLCRNPRDTFVSMWRFTNELKREGMNMNSLDDMFDKFCRGVSISGPFWDHVLGYWWESRKRPKRVLFLKYEELKEQPRAHVKKIAEFLGCPFGPDEEDEGMVDDIERLCCFDNLRGLEVNRNGKQSSGEANRAFFRRGVIGDWKNYLRNDMIIRLDRITEEKLGGSGLKFL